MHYLTAIIFNPFYVGATTRQVTGSIPDGVIVIFRWRNSYLPYCGTGVDSASYSNEYQEYFVGVKADGACGWQLTNFMCILS